MFDRVWHIFLRCWVTPAPLKARRWTEKNLSRYLRRYPRNVREISLQNKSSNNKSNKSIKGRIKFSFTVFFLSSFYCLLAVFSLSLFDNEHDAVAASRHPDAIELGENERPVRSGENTLLPLSGISTALDEESRLQAFFDEIDINHKDSINTE